MYRGDGKVEMNDLVQHRPGNGACDFKDKLNKAHCAKGAENLSEPKYSEESMDDLYKKMVEYLEEHEIYKLMEIVSSAIATKEQH